MSGYGEFTSSEGRIYKGLYKNDTKHGFGIYKWNDPLKAYCGFWEHGKMHGLGYLVSKKSLKYGKWENGKRITWLSIQNVSLIKFSKEQYNYIKYFKTKLEECIEVTGI